MGGAALASILHVTGRPLPSHRCCPIVIFQLLSSNCHPWIAVVVVINIVAVGRSGGIMIVAVSVLVAVAIAVSPHCHHHRHCWCCLSRSICHCHCCCAPWWPIRGAGPNHATEALSMACGWCPTLGLATQGPAAFIRGYYVHDVLLLEIYWCLSNGGAKVPYGRWYLFLH